MYAAAAVAVVAAAAAKACLTLCDPIDGSPVGSSVPGILQARTLEWIAISFSNVWKWSCSVISDSSQPHGLQPTRLLCPWDFPGKSTGVGCHRLLRRICLQCRKSRFKSWVRKTPRKRERPPTPVFLPGEFHGQGSQGRLSSMGLQRVRHDWVTNTFKVN